MASQLHALIHFLAAHPLLGLGAVFAASLLEAVAVVGIVVPGSSVVFVGGVLVGMGVLDPLWTAAAAVVGAVLGDGISYGIGRHYHDRIRTLGPFKRHADLFERGQAHFARNGAVSVFVGRFLGPLRAFVPVVAGMSDMPPARFALVNVLSALAWAAAHLAPGMLAGASLQLAGAVSSRLAVLLVVLGVMGWMVWRSARLVHGQLWPAIVRGRDWAVAWARAGARWPHRAVLSLFDPQRPEASARLASVVVLGASAWVFLGVLQSVLTQDGPGPLDLAVFTALQGMRNAWADGFMVAMTEVGSAAVAVPVIVAVALLMAASRRWRTLAYWIAAMALAKALVWGLKVGVARVRPNAMYEGVEQFSFPSGHATSAIVLFACLAFLLGRGRSARVKAAVGAAAASLVMLIAFSRVYLGAHWLTDVVAGLSAGLAWVSLLGVSYARHGRDPRLPARALSAVSLGTLVLAAGVCIGVQHEADLAQYRPRAEQAQPPLPDWLAAGWRTLARARTDVGGEAEEPLAVQWAATKLQVEAALAGAGWRAPPAWAAGTALLWLLPDPPIGQLPALPKFHLDEVQAIVLARDIDSSHRLVLRLWPAGRAVVPPGAEQRTPLWLGMVTMERLRHPAGVFTFAQTEADFGSALRLLEGDLAAQGVATAKRGEPGAAVLLAWPRHPPA